MDSKHKLQDVFTPSSPARSTFVERESVNYKLVSSLMTPGKQIVVYGHSGVGKTSLLVNKLEQLYSHHFITRCSKDLTFNQVLQHAFDEVDAYYVSEINKKKKSKISAKLAAEYMQFKAELGYSAESEVSTKTQRIVPPQVNAQNLAKFIGASDGCWVLEDFHKIPNSEKNSLAQVMKVFMDMSREFQTVRTIAIGAVGTAHEVVKYDPEMKDRVAEILVPQMTSHEIKEIISKGETLLNVRFEQSVKDNIVEYSDGVAAICHQLCFNMCFHANILETGDVEVVFAKKDFSRALQHYLDGCSDTIKSVFDKAFCRKTVKKYDNAKLILGAMVVLGGKNLSTNAIMREIRRHSPKYPSGNLTTYLHHLENEDHGSVIYKNPNSELYSFRQPTYFAFAKAFFDLEHEKELEHRKNHLKTAIENGEFKDLMNLAIEKIAFEFQKLAFYEDPSLRVKLEKHEPPIENK